MPAMLRNLSARAPRVDDLGAITELRMACDIMDLGISDSTKEAVLAEWQSPDFNLSTDAWVIVTTRGRCVGYAHVMHHSVFVCVHPAYRSRGIGMLLLRLAEARAYEQIDAVSPGVRVTLMTEVSHDNEAARRLLEREGYTPVRHFLRLIGEIEDDPCESCKEFYQHGKIKLDLVVDASNLIGTTHVQQRTGAYVTRLYDNYEKELRTSTEQQTDKMPGEELAVA
jgi:GNAT superfamily N-acetyltransferase